MSDLLLSYYITIHDHLCASLAASEPDHLARVSSTKQPSLIVNETQYKSTESNTLRNANATRTLKAKTGYTPQPEAELVNVKEPTIRLASHA